jgi:hypothetical protein
MKKSKILIACECSGAVRDAFTRHGHYAMSCDLQESDTPGNHYIGDVMDIINDGWDLIIAHPPCTYLSKAGARWLYKGGEINEERMKHGIEAKQFLQSMMDAKCERIAVENPTPLKIFNLPPHTQAIQPFQFGHPYSKRTLLWLKNLPKLVPINVLENYTPFLPSNTGGKKRGQSYSIGISKNAKQSSNTFHGIAEAMAQQWGVLL